jgi:hypothetical protein
MTRRTLLMLALMTVATVAPMATAQACSCMVPNAAQFLQESDFVFAGSLVERPDPGGGQAGGLGGLENVVYTFEVDAVYRGDLRDSTVQVWSASNGAACGFELAVGEPVAIAASVSAGQLTGGLCATFGVDQLEAAAADAGIEPTVPQPAEPETPIVAAEQPEKSGFSSLVIIGSIAALATLLVAGLTIHSRGRAEFSTRR